MPTTDNRPGNEAQRAITGPLERRASRDDTPTLFERAKTALKRFAFPLVLLVMIIIVWATLSAIGLAASENPLTHDKNPMGKIIFPTNAAPVLAWYGLAVMIYPAFKAVVRMVAKKTSQFELVRLVIAIATTIAGFLLIHGTLAALQGLGVWLWGAKISGVVALVLCALAAYLLTLYKADDERLTELEKDLPGMEWDLRNAEAAQKLAMKEETLWRGQLEDRTAAYESLAAVEKEKGAAYIAALKLFNESDDVKEQVEVSTKLTKANEDLRLLRSDITILETQVAKEKDHGEKRSLQSELTDKITERTELRDTTIPELTARLKVLDERIEKSPLKDAVDTAKLKSEEAAEKAKEYHDNLKGIKGEHTKAEAAKNVASGKVTDYKQAHDDAQQEIANIRAERKSLWRDSVWVPVIIPIVLWVLALLGYTTWEGWMVVEFFS